MENKETNFIKTLIVLIILALIVFAIIYSRKQQTVVVQTPGNDTQVIVTPSPEPSQNYSNNTLGFSIKYPSGYSVDEMYKYNLLGVLGKDISGVKFTIPAALANGTNLSTDSYVSVEEIPNTKTCSASLFMQSGTKVSTVNSNGTTYSTGSTSDAAAGNRYEETVYAIHGTNPCVAVRYFIHYGVYENYPPETTTEFNKAALIAQFDAMRNTLVIYQ